MIDKTQVKKILVINLSNIGDAILTTPVIQALSKNFPQADLTVLVGPRAFNVFKNDSRVHKKIIYDKGTSWKNKLRLVNRMRQDKYDLLVDLRHSAFSIFVGARYRSSVFKTAPKRLIHMKDRHLWRVQSLGLAIDNILGPSVEIGAQEKEYVHNLLRKWQIKKGQLLLAVSPGARSMTKCWVRKGYQQLLERLIKEYRAKVIVVGDEQDCLIAQEIIGRIKPRPVNLCGLTSIGELAYLLTKCKLLICNDSAPMHLAWAVHTPVIAIFGPTDYRKYAPGGPRDMVLRKDLVCSPCEQSLCPKGTRECMKLITADEVFAACKKIIDAQL